MRTSRALRSSDFRVRGLDGIADDWPVTYDELEPFLDLNDRMMGVAGLAGDPAYPPKPPRQTLPIPLGPLGHTIAPGGSRASDGTGGRPTAGLADGAIYYESDGQVHEQKARLVVLSPPTGSERLACV